MAAVVVVGWYNDDAWACFAFVNCVNMKQINLITVFV